MDLLQSLPGHLKQNTFKLDAQQECNFAKLETSTRLKNKAQEEQALIRDKLSSAKLQLHTKHFTTVIPVWDAKDEKDDKKKAKFASDLAKVKAQAGNAFTKNNQLLKSYQQKKHIEAEFDPVPLDIPQQYKLARSEVEAVISSQSLPNTQQVNIAINPVDVYTLPVPVSNLLSLFQQPFDYLDFEKYVARFKTLSTVFKTIKKITKNTHRQKLVFKQNTVEGQIRTKQLNRADMFNRQLETTMEQLLKLCAGAFYMPDQHFKTVYNNLPKEIQAIIKVQLMKEKKVLTMLELIGCGEAVNYLTFDTEIYNSYIKEVKEQFAATGTWEPFKHYQKAQAVQKGNARIKGVAAEYKKCGYEMRLSHNTEAVVLYFVCQLAKDQGGTPCLESSELVVLAEKIKDFLQRFDQVDQGKKIKDDPLWLEVKKFVKTRAQRHADKFVFDNLAVSYSTGQAVLLNEDEMAEYNAQVHDEPEIEIPPEELEPFIETEQAEPPQDLPPVLEAPPDAVIDAPADAPPDFQPPTEVIDLPPPPADIPNEMPPADLPVLEESKSESTDGHKRKKKSKKETEPLPQQNLEQTVVEMPQAPPPEIIEPPHEAIDQSENPASQSDVTGDKPKRARRRAKKQADSLDEPPQE